MINHIISQMNNNRLSTSSSPLIDRDLLLRGLKVILDVVQTTNTTLKDK